MAKKLPKILVDFSFVIPVFPHLRILPALLRLRIGLNQVISCQFPQFLFILLLNSPPFTALAVVFLLGRLLCHYLLPGLEHVRGTGKIIYPAFPPLFILDAPFPTLIYMAALGLG